MILVDSSVWVDYLRGNETKQTGRLDSLLGIEPLAVGDLILAEVLQGMTSEKDFKEVMRLMLRMHDFSIRVHPEELPMTWGGGGER